MYNLMAAGCHENWITYNTCTDHEIELGCRTSLFLTCILIEYTANAWLFVDNIFGYDKKLYFLFNVLSVNGQTCYIKIIRTKSQNIFCFVPFLYRYGAWSWIYINTKEGIYGFFFDVKTSRRHFIVNAIFTESIMPLAWACHYGHREIGLVLVPFDRRLIFSRCWRYATVRSAVANIAREVRRNAKIRNRIRKRNRIL